MLIGVRGGFWVFSRVFELFSNIWGPGKVKKWRANRGHTASARRIDPRYPEVQISTFKISIFYDLLSIFTIKISDFLEKTHTIL